MADVMQSKPDLYDAAAVAKRLRIEPKTVRKRWRERRLGFVQPARGHRYSTDAQIRDYLASVTVDWPAPIRWSGVNVSA
jgi:hypothetical protein